MRGWMAGLACLLMLGGCGGGSEEAPAGAGGGANDTGPGTGGEPAAMNASTAPPPPPEPPENVAHADATVPGITAPPVDPATEPTPGAGELGRDAAAATLRVYFERIAAGEYRRAWAMWHDGGRASGMRPRAFADSFRRYASFDAEVGRPGRIDAGAGQRYVEIPVRVTGRLRDGNQPFVLEGKAVLRRTADIDGATLEQRRWHIASTDLNPRPGETAAGEDPTPEPQATDPIAPAEDELPRQLTAIYHCDDGSRLTVAFDNEADTATLRAGDRLLGVLSARRAGSGIWYRGDGYNLRGKGNAATLSRRDRPPLECVAQ